MNKIAIIAVAGIAAAATGQVRFSEILGSTGGPDGEFIELGNFGAGSVDISGWSIELWDSDVGAAFGASDAGAPYVVAAGTTLGSGETYTFGNTQAESFYGAPNNTGIDLGNGFESFGFDASLPAEAIENSSYTAILVDALGNVVESWFFSDGGAGDEANRAGSTISADVTVPLDGSFLQSGYGRTAIDSFFELNFSSPGFNADPSVNLNNGTIEGGTPGVTQFAFIPTPGAMAAFGVAGLAAARRRR